jgi:replication factor A1
MLEFLKNPEAIRNAIMSSKKISEKELAERVGKRQEKFNGLINEAAALYSIAKELGVDVEAERELQFTGIGKLSTGMKDVNIHARVMRVFAPRKFEREGKEGWVCNILIADGSGEATLVLWHRDVELVEKGIIEKGDTVDVLGAYVKDSGEVHLSMGGQVLKVKERTKLPEIASELNKIGEIEEGMGSVSFVAEVLEVGAVNSFERNGRKKLVSSLLVGDESGKVRLTLWEDNAELAGRVNVGDVVKVEEGYVKKGLFGTELHADWRSRVIINPRNALLTRVGVESIERVPIAKLKDGMHAEVEGVIAGACRRTAGEKPEVDALLKDDSGEVHCIFANAKEFLGVKRIPHDVDADTILELKKGELIGKKIVVRGSARRGSSGVELAVERVV